MKPSRENACADRVDGCRTASSLIVASLLALTASPFVAQDATAATQPSAIASAPRDPAAPPDLTKAGALPDEFVILSELKGVVLVPDASRVKSGPFRAQPGFDISQVPILPADTAGALAAGFVGQPVSHASLQRISSALRLTLMQLGYPFGSAYLPPQDITEGWVQVVVHVSRAAAETKVEGAKYFSTGHYRSAIRQRPGEPINLDDLKSDIDWLNRNPFRQVTTVTQPGPQVGSTELRLRVNERFPLRLSAGYSNTGSLVSDEDRVFAGVTWGNAFGRGDQLGYQYSASPDAKTSVTHSANYSADLPWRHTLRVFGAYSELVGRVAVPLSLEGRNAQLGLRYEIPLRPLRPKITQALAFGFDFKASDNNLLFAAFPITDNVTHVAQFSATYTLGFTDRLGQTEVSTHLVASPGGLTDRNRTRAFGVSRALSRPDYVYGQLSARRQVRLPRGFAWSVRGQFQLSNANLLGSEQMAGGGSASVRGYEEGEAYGDHGLLLSHELALPTQSLARLFRATRGSDSLQLFAFQDYVALRSHERLPGERRITELHSLGAGLRYQLGPNLSVDVTHGWQLRESSVSRSGDRARTHVSLQAGF